MSGMTKLQKSQDTGKKRSDDQKHSEELRQMQYIRALQEAKLEPERNMTSYFAHELRNPLHAIDSVLGLMPSNLSADTKSLVDSMVECTSFMSSIMNNLLIPHVFPSGIQIPTMRHHRVTDRLVVTK